MIRRRPHPLHRRPTRLFAAIALALGLAGAGQARAQLVISPVFTGDITGAGNAATIEGTINSAITYIDGQFAGVASNAVSIVFDIGAIGGLGQSNSSYYTPSYAQYTGALGTAATTINDPVEVSAYNNLGSGNGAAGGGSVTATSADIRMLKADGGLAGFNCGTCLGGYTNAGVFNPVTGTNDGVITLTTGDIKNTTTPLLAYGRTAGAPGAVTGGQYDATRVIEHEIDEVLGIGGSGSQLPGNTNAAGTIGPLDLFRYSAAGIPSLSVDPSVVSYLSVDGGATPIAYFNQGFTDNNGTCVSQNDCGDFSDWADQLNGGAAPNAGPNSCGVGLVQDAFSCPNQIADISFNGPEGEALQAIGYDVPEPMSLALLAVAWAGLGLTRQRKKNG